jgi:farnesyl diphosphate synthase
VSAAQQPSAFSARLAAIGARVEAELDRLLSAAPLVDEIIRPTRLLDAMRHAALGGGKRLRPFLTIETAAMLGCPEDRAVRAACAIEFVHCYSLVHDDLPAMDDDDLRRGRPTVHKAFDEATAILAGDSLLTLAFDVMADDPTHPDAAVRARLVLGLARASGLGGMAGGQMLDLDAEREAGPMPRAGIERLQAMKTGALLRYAVEAGAIVAGATPGERAALVDYGLALGAAFQVADDILDAEGDTAALGKKAGKDAGRNKGTLVGALGLDGAKRARDELVARALDALKPFGARANILAEAARFTAARAH